MLRRVVCSLLLIITQVANGALTTQACTSLRVKTADGGIYYARTMEFPTSPRAAVAIFPKDTPPPGPAPTLLQKPPPPATLKSRWFFMAGLQDFLTKFARGLQNQRSKQL